MDKSAFRFIDAAKKAGKSPRDIQLACQITNDQMKAWGKTWTPDDALKQKIVDTINNGVTDEQKTSVSAIFDEPTKPGAKKDKPAAIKKPAEKKEIAKESAEKKSTDNTKVPTPEMEKNITEPDNKKIEDDSMPTPVVDNKNDKPVEELNSEKKPEFKKAETQKTEVQNIKAEKDRTLEDTPVADQANDKPAKKRSSKKAATPAISFESVANDIRTCADNLNRAFDAYKASLPKYTEKQQELINIIIDLKEKDLDLLIATAKRLR